MIDIYVGKKLYYLNRYYNVIFAQIEKINNVIITIKNEYGCRFNIQIDQIGDNNRINPKENETGSGEKYLQCLCGCMRFYYYENKLYCRDCNIEYEKDELSSLDKCDYIKEEVEIDENKLH